jgi:hypothetical protein
MAEISIPRKKSPRAPSISLDEAIDRVMRAYDKERLHPAPIDVVAQNLGYKGANSGTALTALASLRYYGLLERPSDGLLAVTKDVESLKFAPDESVKRSLLLGFLRRPALFAELLEKYSTGLPSDANLKYDLIQQRGFLPATASDVVSVFRRSVEFTQYFESAAPDLVTFGNNSEVTDQDVPPDSRPRESRETVPWVPRTPTVEMPEDGDYDRIPVRLPGARRAWLMIPSPFFNSDKQRLKAQIDLLLTEDEDPSH